ncbi:MAG: hypothetical protein P8090_08320 [Gammaproteobacteria bacterium]
MPFEEGQIYQGNVSLSGSEGPERRWIVVTPEGKLHAHSIDDPLEMHCLTVDAMKRGLANGRLHLAGTDPQHPVLQLQREKQQRHIRDSHLGLSGRQLDSMLDLLDEASETNAPYALFAAGEILALANAVLCGPDKLDQVRQRVRDNLDHLQADRRHLDA